MSISKSLKRAKSQFLDTVHHGEDILHYDFVALGAVNACLFFIDGMVKKDTVNKFVLQPMQLASLPDGRISAEYLLEVVTSNAESSLVTDMDKCVNAVLSGDAVVFVDGLNTALLIGAKGYDTRGINEPPNSSVIKGPREGFTEDVKKNTILLRRKLKSPDLMFRKLSVGKYSNTVVMVAYLNGIADETVLEKILNRIQDINIDGVVDSSYVASFLEERRYSIFKQVGNTEKPDILASRLLEGRIAVFVDGSPIVLTLPFVLLEDLQASQDYYERPARATFVRFLRFFAIFAAVLLPGLYVAAQVFHLQILPLRFLIKVMGSVREIPLSPALEMLAVLLIFEILKDSSLRMPKYVGMALSVVSALVLGETAVNAGLISPPSIMIMALSSVAMYTIPDEEGSFSLLRIVFLILGGSLGILGILLGIAFLTAYLVCLSSYNTPYLAPFAPFIANDQQDGFLKKSLLDMNKRPFSIPRTQNDTRQRSSRQRDAAPNRLP